MSGPVCFNMLGVYRKIKKRKPPILAVGKCLILWQRPKKYALLQVHHRTQFVYHLCIPGF